MFLGGPGSIHAVSSEEQIEAISELGVALLLCRKSANSPSVLGSIGRTSSGVSEATYAHVIVRSCYETHTGSFATAGAHALGGDEEQVGERLANYLLDWLATNDSSESRR